ncbi:hypothetical protein [Qipengyuania flava]|uniref:hypothetical protein n=1 Tax=Qipengyuania flava TaxID=192812 RepID=UPI001CD41A32|nr:hypothetical protein [Qipengyuania flava]MCA0890302.1 hypothetical protein [Qipengyuania flava]
MHDDFWSCCGRKDWYEPEPNSKVFLANFFIDVGKIRHGPKWPGAVQKPSSASALPLKREIAQAAASGLIQTFVLNPKTFEFQPIARSGWRNPKALAARFSRCRIDAADPVSSAAEGGHHGPIYVERDSAMAYLAAIQSASLSPTDTVKLDHLSTYIRFMIFVAQQEQIDERHPPELKALKTKIINEWKPWRLAQSNTKTLPAEAVVTETLAAHMATLMRGEKARAIKGGGGGIK